VTEVVKLTLECFEVVGAWHCRMVVVRQDEEGDYAEPYVLTVECKTLWMAGPGWQALAVLQEFQKHLDAALRDGYE
jgi:hypothetical protein